MSANALTERYSEELEHLKLALSQWQQKLECLAKPIDPNVQVSGRYKKLQSLLVKAYKKDPENPRAWADFGDLVALKVIFPTMAGAESFTQLLLDHSDENGIECSLDRRRPEPDKLEYSSDQFDLSDQTICDSHGQGFKVEVQVRTVVSDAWYMIDHRLRYKNPTELPSNLERRVLRLIALAELFDEEVSSLVNDVSDFEEKSEAGKFNRVNKLFMDFTGRYTSPARPAGLFETLLSAYKDYERDHIESTLQQHLESGGLGAHYKAVIEQHQPGADDFVEKYDWLYLEPESLLIAHLAQKPRFLKSIIENSDFERIVLAMADELKVPASRDSRILSQI